MTLGPNKRASKRHENMLFFKRLLKNPKALGAIAPSSKGLAKMIARHVIIDETSYVVEVGAGTGRFTRVLLEAGILEKNLIVIELDHELCVYLKKNFPGITIIQGDATKLHTLLADGVVKNVDTIVSGIPLINLSKEEQIDLFKSFQQTLSPEGQVLQFTYAPISPLSHKKLGLTATRLGLVFRNVPPATVWSYKFNIECVVKKRRHPFQVYLRIAQQKARTKIKEVRRATFLQKS